MSSGGGGASGAVSFPEYLQDHHDYYIDGSNPGSDVATTIAYSMNDLIDTAQDAASPYGDAYDPRAVITKTDGSPLDNMDDEFSATKTLIDALDSDTDWGTFITYAGTKTTELESIDFLDSLNTAISGLITAVENVLDGSTVQDIVDSFESNRQARFLREVGVWSAGMAVAHASFTSSYMIGLALRQDEFAKSVDQFEREVKYNIYGDIIKAGINSYLRANVVRVNNEDQMIIQGADLMSKINAEASRLKLQLLQMKMELERVNIVAEKERVDRDQELDVDDALWDFEIMMYGANMLSSISGAGVGRKLNQMSKGQSILGGTLAGASIGAQFGPEGAGVGATAGALLSWALY